MPRQNDDLKASGGAIKSGLARKIKSASLIVMASMALAACGTSFRSDVATFHDIAPIQGQTVALETSDPVKAKSLEYAHYAKLIGAELERIGYRFVSSGSADLTLAFDLRVADAREKIRSRGGFAGGAGWGGGWWGPGWGGGWWGPGWGGGIGNRIDSTTVYQTELAVSITDANGKRVFDGRAETDVKGNRLPETVPLLARTLFTDFPGKNGVTRKIRLTPEEREEVEARAAASTE